MKTREMFLCTIDKEDGELVTLRLAPVDLGKLLALADEMDRHADMAAGHVAYAARFDFAGWARRIREALGVSE